MMLKVITILWRLQNVHQYLPHAGAGAILSLKFLTGGGGGGAGKARDKRCAATADQGWTEA